MTAKTVEILTDEDMDALTLAFRKGRGDKGVTDGELADLLNWAYQTRKNARIVDSLIAGRASVADMEDGEPQLFVEGPLQRRPRMTEGCCDSSWSTA
jgi:hypothetical protein